MILVVLDWVIKLKKQKFSQNLLMIVKQFSSQKYLSMMIMRLQLIKMDNSGLGETTNKEEQV